MNTAYWLNTLWMYSCAREARAFRVATRDVRTTQEALLRRILRSNEDTWYGRRFAFSTIRSADAYRRRLPVMDDEQLNSCVRRVADGEARVLTREPTLLLEPTGGASRGEKMVPYTRALKRQFQRAVSVWIDDVLRQVPGVRRGRAYWSISPLVDRPRRSPGGIAIGFEKDQDYLAGWQRWAVSRLLVTPPLIRRLRHPDNARYVTLLGLLASRDLALCSVWSPTFLTSLLDDLPDAWESICDDLRRGRLRLPQAEAAVPRILELPADPGRAGQLQSLGRTSGRMAEVLRACWPQLALISCWADAASALYVPRLQGLFPWVRIQPKGLLATEGVVSIPRVGQEGAALAIRSHFFEFLEVLPGQANPETVLADALVAGNRYRVLLTTGGGLYRYDLGDEVQVVGHEGECPLLRFAGRGQAVSDLVGEKLHEQHVQRAIRIACDATGLGLRFALLAPTREVPARYRLYLESGPADEATLGRVRARLEEQLCENPQYRGAIAAGQLRPLDIRRLAPRALQTYQRVRMQQGQRLGDIKPPALDCWTGWDEAFSRSDILSR